MGFAAINGFRMSYVERGPRDGVPLLLVHGFPFDHRMWGEQLDPLSGGTRVIAPDLRGHGESEVTPGPLTMAQHADDLAVLLDQLGVAQAVVAGLSMGGYIAFAFWRRYRERVMGLVLADTRAEPDTEAGRAGRDATAAKVREMGPAAVATDMLPRLLAPGNQANQALVQTVREMIQSQPAEGMIGALAGLKDRADSRGLLETISVPTLVIVGEQDAITPVADAEVLARGIRRASLVVLKDAGHLSPMENPTGFNAALREYLGQFRP